MKKLIIILSIIFLTRSVCCLADPNYYGCKVRCDSVFAAPYDPYAFLVQCTLTFETNMDIDFALISREDISPFIIKESIQDGDTAIFVLKKKPPVTGLSKEPVPSPLGVQIYYNDFWMANDKMPQLSENGKKYYLVTKGKSIVFFKRYDLAGTDAADLRAFFWDKRKLKIKSFLGVIPCRIKNKTKGDEVKYFHFEIPANKLVGMLR